MDYTVTVSKNGQITLPAELRRKANILPGTKVVLTLSDNNKFLITKKEKNLFETSWGDYDFQKDMKEDINLQDPILYGKYK